MPQTKGEKKGCVLTPFSFTLILCIILGGVLIFEPNMTFESYDYASKLQFDMSAQVFMPQKDKFEALVYSTNNASGAELYVYKPGTELAATEKGWVVQHSVQRVIENGDAFVFPIYYVKNSYMEVDAFGAEGCLLEFKNLNEEEFKSFKPSGKIHLESGLTSANVVKYNTTFDSFGKSYAVLLNVGYETNVSFKVNIRSPLYNVSSAPALYTCVGMQTCKLENLPRKYFAVVNIHTDYSSVANSVSLTQQFNDRFRWVFPSVLYAVLVFIVICVGVGQAIFNHMKAKKSSPTAYSTIEDPLEKENPSINS